MTKEEIKSYIKKLQQRYPIDYQEVEKVKLNDNQFELKYTRTNGFNEPFKIIPIIDYSNFKTITRYGVIEIPISPMPILIPLSSTK